ncbi:DUF4214 domain-containing protein [uncultured Sulfitobacter sp.]|uniref:DUF4214 domain-containing protein n=1 Tax=uncultured Sulfitobacter sp. TaxID=191468 RepID=UPI00260705D2|nr:DUF4214 domain-containing protein [uncultured Sulfitobacter sp.]
MPQETSRTDVRVTANDQNMWATGDAFIVEWGDYIPLIGGEIINYKVVSVEQPVIGRVTFEGDQVTWDAAGAVIEQSQTVEVFYTVRDEGGFEVPMTTTLDLENTLRGLEVSVEGSDAEVGQLTFDAVPIEFRLVDREYLTLEKFIDFDIDLDAREALEDSGVLGTLRAARDQAAADLNAANATLNTEASQASTAANKLADTAETWGLTVAKDIASGFATVTQTAVNITSVVSETARSGLATTYSDIIESLIGQIIFINAEIQILEGRKTAASTGMGHLIDIYNHVAGSESLATPDDEMLPVVVDAINAVVEASDISGFNFVSNGDTYKALLDLVRVGNPSAGIAPGSYREFLSDLDGATANLVAERNAIENALDTVIAQYEALDPIQKFIFGYVDFVNGLIEGGLDAIVDTVSGVNSQAQSAAAQAQTNLNQNGGTADIGDVLSDLGNVIEEGAEAAAAAVAASAASVAATTTQATLDAANAIGEGNKLKFELALDAQASAQAGIVIDLRFDGGSVDSNLDYALTSTSTYDAVADTFTILPTATSATTGEEIAFTTISPNAQFYVGLAYFADVTVDIMTEYFGKAIGFDLFDSEGPSTSTEYFSISGVFDIIDIDTANLADAGILPDLPIAAFQLPEFNEDNQIQIEFGNWVDEIITGLYFGIPILETEGKEAEFSPDFYKDETNVLDNLKTILSDFASAQLGFSEDFKTLLEANGAPTEFGETDFFEIIEAVFDSLTAADEISDDGFIPIIELAVGSDTALFHIDTFMNDISGLDLANVGSLGFFTSSGTSNEVAKIEIDVDTLATVIVGQVLGIPPETSVNFNPLQRGWSLADELEESDLTTEQQAVINSAVALDFGLDIADLKIGADAAFDQKFALRIDDMDYQVTFEDGTSQRILASAAEALVFENVSALEDVNGDGEIDYTLTLTPDAEFFNDTELKLAIGYTLDILKANLELGLSLPLSQIPNLGLTDIEVFEQNLALGPLFRASADLDLLTVDIFEDRFDYLAGTAAVEGSFVLPDVNSAPTGSVSIEGTPRVGETLTVASTLMDEDGLGELKYQWVNGPDIDYALSGGVLTTINSDGTTTFLTDRAFSAEAAGLLVGETGNSYTVTEADEGKTISVRVSYVDGGGTREFVDASLPSVIPVTSLGTSSDDLIIGTIQAEEILGLEGADTISGGGSTDILSGGEGGDHLYGDGFELRYALPEANQVFRLYQATFNRTPDEMGHKHWTSELFTGNRTLAEVRDGFVGSKEFQNTYSALTNADFVKQMYINVLDRDFDQGEVSQTEIDNWTNRITDTFTRADVVNGFAESQQLINKTTEAANKLGVNSNPAIWSDDVYRLYQATLDREPDAAGFTGWLGRLANGEALVDIIPGFTNSQEFQNAYGSLDDPEDFVKLLYNNVLGRDFDAGEVSQDEVTGWTSQLSDTFTSANLVNGFSQSQEFANKTASDVKGWIRAQGVDDKINGGADSNVLAGGAMADIFMFDQEDGASNKVVDLEAWDYLSFSGFGYDTAADARSHLTQSAGNVIFEDQGTVITFERYQLNNVTDDMILV